MPGVRPLSLLYYLGKNEVKKKLFDNDPDVEFGRGGRRRYQIT